jgi:hypothetical protein
MAALNLVVRLPVEGRDPRPEHRWVASGKRPTSPISSVKMAAITGPTPWMAWIAR